MKCRNKISYSLHKLRSCLLLTLAIPILVSSCKKSKENPALPSLTVSANTATEGNGENTTLAVTFRLSSPSSVPVSCKFSTSDSTAKAGSDYLAITDGSILFNPGETTKTADITIVSDTIMEFTEYFNLNVTDVSNATPAGQHIVLTIVDDDTMKPFLAADGYDVADSYPGMQLEWSDEFNGPVLNEQDWNYETGGGGWGNNELEFYTKDTTNVFIKDGKLVIRAINDNGSYTSGRLTTQNKKEFQYGLINIRAKLPTGQGLWPALWMLGSDLPTVNWPACGEVDIMELIGREPDRVYGTAHWDQGGHQSKGSNFNNNSAQSFQDGYHIFSILWEPGRITWYVDFNRYFVLTTSDTGNWPFDAPFFFIFNVAVGGLWPGNPDGTTQFPQSMSVDYIRVYTAK